jgi:gas vesicle protein GvpL/GvpF
MKTPDATYVFCLVQSARTPSIRRMPASVPGAGPPRLIAVERDIWAVGADAPLDRYSAERLGHDLQDIDAISRHALAHASVVEFFFKRMPVIPLKVFTLFSSDDKLRDDLRRRTGRLRRLFSRLRGFEEWGVRIVAGAVEEDSTRRLTSGRDYLQAKRRLTQQNAAPPSSSVREIGAALKALAKFAAKTRKETLPPPAKGRSFVSGASFLVKSTRRARWSREVEKIGVALAKGGHRLEVTGPWPPYHFVSR